jgi:Leucine-rich repeat (LRR) protein
MPRELIFYGSEFEKVVRRSLNIKDRAITEEDVLAISTLDCSGFPFDARDYETLLSFKNLACLVIDTRADELDFLKSLPLLEELNLETWGGNNIVDFRVFSCLPHLKTLVVSGGVFSDIGFKNLEGLIALKNLENLTLHEFGSVDLRPLRQMSWLKKLFCGYANKVYDIDALASLCNLKSLELVDIEMDSLDFLDAFPDDIILELCSLRVNNGIDYSRLSRFVNGDFDEIESSY